MILNNCYNYCHYNSSELWIIMKHNTYIYIYIMIITEIIMSISHV